MLLFVSGAITSCQKNESQITKGKTQITETRAGFCTPDLDKCKESTKTAELVVSGCPITVSYKINICQVGGTGSIFEKVHITDFKILKYPIGKACQPIKFMLTLPKDGSYEQWYTNNYNPFYKNLTLLVEDIEIKNLTARGSITPCSFALGTSTVDWVESGCYKVCSGPVDEEGWAELINVKCGVGCCFRTTPVCVDENNVIIKSPSANITGPSVCEKIPNECPDNPKNKCRPACDKL